MITLSYRFNMFFILLVETTITSKVFKQNRLAHHKYLHQVFLVQNITEVYTCTVYVAGKVFTIEVPFSIESYPYKIVNWKVVNSNPNRLMYISDGQAFVMIKQTVKRRLVYPNENIGSIIVLGNNEALHMPTIINTNKTRPKIAWNYLELLYFDENDETIKIIESIPWFDENDWVYIKEWKMLDYITIGTKMYILSKRTITVYSKVTEQVSHELSIIQLSLEVDTNLLSTAVELHRKMASSSFVAQFLVHLGTIMDEFKRYSIIIQVTGANNNSSLRCFLPKMEARFKAINISCTKIGLCNQLHQHLRSVPINSKCSDKANTSCPFPGHLYLSESIDVALIASEEITPNNFVRTFHVPYPYEFCNAIYPDKDNQLFFCYLQPPSSLGCYLTRYNSSKLDMNTGPVLNVVNGKLFLLSNSNSLKLFSWEYPCEIHRNCFDCIMYGFTYGCIWSEIYSCEHRLPSQVINNRYFIINYCKKIVSFSVKYFQETKSMLEIEFQEAFDSVNRFNEISVLVGPTNECIDIKVNTSYITCELNSRIIGNFIVNVTFYNDVYLDTMPIIALSSDTILIKKANVWVNIVIITILVIFAIIAIISLLFKCSFQKINQKARALPSQISDFMSFSIDSEVRQPRTSRILGLRISPKQIIRKVEKVHL